MLALGVTLTAQGKYDAAVEHFDAVLHRNPGFESALSARAHALQSKGDFEAAMEAYHGALDVHFERVATQIIEGQGITHDDPELFKHVMFNELKRKPFTAVVYNSIGLCYLNLGEKDGAREYFKESIRHTPNDFGFPDPAENLELLNPLKPPIPDDTRETFKQNLTSTFRYLAAPVRVKIPLYWCLSRLGRNTNWSVMNTNLFAALAKGSTLKS